MGGSGKDAVCNKHHEVITKQKVKKLRYVIIIKKSYNKGRRGKVAVCNDHHEVITKEQVEKLRYVMIIIKL